MKFKQKEGPAYRVRVLTEYSSYSSYPYALLSKVCSISQKKDLLALYREFLKLVDQKAGLEACMADVRLSAERDVATMWTHAVEHFGHRRPEIDRQQR